MKIPYKDKDLAEQEVRSYKRLDAESSELYKEMRQTKLIIIVWLGLIAFYVFARAEDFRYATEVILFFGVLYVLYFFDLKNRYGKNLRESQSIYERFNAKYDVENDREFIGFFIPTYTFEDDEYVPWEHISRETLLETKIENTEIRLILDPDDRGLRYVISGNLSESLYSKSRHIIRYEVFSGLKKFQIQRLRDLFKEPLEFTMTPHLVEAFFNDYKITFTKWVNSEEPEEFKHEEESTRQTQERTIIHAKWEIDGGAEDQIVSIKQRADGTWCLHESNSGPKSVQFFGKDENEYWIDIKEENLIDLLQISFQVSFEPQREEPFTIQKLEKILKDKGIPHETGVW